MATPVYDYVRELVALDGNGKNARDEFFLDPTNRFDDDWTPEARAVLFAMDPQLLSMYISVIENQDLSNEIYDYYTYYMKEKWPAPGDPEEEPFHGMGPPSPPSSLVLRPKSSAAGWAHPTPKVHKYWPKQGRLTDGTIAMKLSGEGFLPGAEIELREYQGSTKFGATAASADWGKKSFHVTHLKVQIPIPTTPVPPTGYYDVFVRNIGWSKWLISPNRFQLKP